MNSGLLRGLGQGLQRGAGLYVHYSDQKNREEELNKRLAAQKEILNKRLDAEKGLLKQRLSSQIAGVDAETGRPVTVDEIISGKFKGKLVRTPSALEAATLEAGGAGGAIDKGGNGINFSDEKKFYELGQKITGAKDFGIGREFGGKPPNRHQLNELSRLAREPLTVQKVKGVFSDKWMIVRASDMKPAQDVLAGLQKGAKSSSQAMQEAQAKKDAKMQRLGQSSGQPTSSSASHVFHKVDDPGRKLKTVKVGGKTVFVFLDENGREHIMLDGKKYYLPKSPEEALKEQKASLLTP